MDKRVIIYIIIAFAVGMFIGYTWGFANAINIMVEKASKFINVNESLIRDYLHGAGVGRI